MIEYSASIELLLFSFAQNIHMITRIPILYMIWSGIPHAKVVFGKPQDVKYCNIHNYRIERRSRYNTNLLDDVTKIKHYISGNRIK